MTLRNKALVRRFYNDVFNGRQLHLIADYVSPDFVDRNPEPGQALGLDGIVNMVRSFGEAFPDMLLTVDHIVAEGDLVGSRIVMTGTHLGTFNGVVATGRAITVGGFDWARIQNGLIVERWGVFDQAGLMSQIGITPAPTSDVLKKLSHRYYEVLDGSKGDIAALRSDLFHNQVVTHFAGQPALDADGLQLLMSGLYKAFDVNHKFTAQICEGDTVYNHLTVNLLHKGDFAGVSATKKNVTIDAMTSQRWVDGKLVEQYINVDMVSLLVQIGVIPAPKA